MWPLPSWPFCSGAGAGITQRAGSRVAFLTLGLIVSLGRLVPAHPHGLLEDIPQRISIELLVLFPYFLYRFATVFAPPAQRLQRFVAAMTIVLSIGTFALPRFPAAGEARPWWFMAYVVLFLIHWSLLSVVVTVRLWRAGRGQPGVASGRMRLLAFAAASLTVAIIGTAFQSGNDSAVAALTAALASVSGLCFLLGIAPPGIVRVLWRTREQQRLQEAIRGLMTLATTRSEVADRVFGPVAALVGAGAAAVLDAHGELLASRGLDDETRTLGGGRRAPRAADSPEVLTIEATGATFLVWTSRYAPFFGDSELRVAADRRRDDRRRARPRAALRAGARVAARPGAGERGDGQLRRARRARAADAGDDDPRLRPDAAPSRRPARRRAAGGAAHRARAADGAHGLARRAAARPVAPRRRGGRRPAAAHPAARAAAGGRRRRRRLEGRPGRARRARRST